MYGAIILPTAIWLIIVASMACVPYFSRKTILFGVSITEAHHGTTEFRALRRGYLYSHVALGLVWWIVSFFVMRSMDSTASGLWVLCSYLLMIIFSSCCYLYCYYAAKRLKAARAESSRAEQLVAVDITFHRRATTYSNWWFLVHLAVVSVCVLLAALYYDQFPDQIATHYDLKGNADRLSDKSFWSVFMLNFIQLFLVAVFWLINTAIRKSKQQISFEAPEQSREQNIRFRRIWSLFLIVMGLLMVLVLALFQFSPLITAHNGSMIAIATILPLAIVIGTFVLSFVTGQGGSKLKLNKGTPVKFNRQMKDDDKYWTFGAIYYNPNDPAIFVEKRVGIGWTVNAGRPLGKAILIAPLIIVIVVNVLFYIYD